MSKKIYVSICVGVIVGLMIEQRFIGINFFLAHPELDVPITSAIVIVVIASLTGLYFFEKKK